MASICQSIEHIFGIMFNIFHVFDYPERFRLLRDGADVFKLFFNSFFIWNCYQCLYHSSSTFSMVPPTLEDYLPLDEVLEAAPQVRESDLGLMYRYYN